VPSRHRLTRASRPEQDEARTPGSGPEHLDRRPWPDAERLG
jgi:hypothetical protein